MGLGSHVQIETVNAATRPITKKKMSMAQSIILQHYEARSRRSSLACHVNNIATALPAANVDIEDRIANLKHHHAWITTQLIERFTKGGANVLDLACGKGGDLMKWEKAGIRSYVGVDMVEGLLEEAQRRHKKSQCTFTARFMCEDGFGCMLLWHLGLMSTERKLIRANMKNQDNQPERLLRKGDQLTLEDPSTIQVQPATLAAGPNSLSNQNMQSDGYERANFWRGLYKCYQDSTGPLPHYDDFVSGFHKSLQHTSLKWSCICEGVVNMVMQQIMSGGSVQYNIIGGDHDGKSHIGLGFAHGIHLVTNEGLLTNRLTTLPRDQVYSTQFCGSSMETQGLDIHVDGRVNLKMKFAINDDATAMQQLELLRPDQRLVFKAGRQAQPLRTGRELQVNNILIRGELSYIDDGAGRFDVCSCQFALHYAWSSEERARGAIRNVAALLRPGGFFIGTIPDAEVVVRRLKEAVAAADHDDHILHVAGDHAHDQREGGPAPPARRRRLGAVQFGNKVYTVKFNDAHALRALSSTADELSLLYGAPGCSRPRTAKFPRGRPASRTTVRYLDEPPASCCCCCMIASSNACDQGIISMQKMKAVQLAGTMRSKCSGRRPASPIRIRRNNIMMRRRRRRRRRGRSAVWFGVEYEFYLEGAVEHCPEWLVPLPALIHLARQHGLELVFASNFEHILSRPPHRHHLLCSPPSTHELECMSLYLAFAFRKL